MAKKYFGVCKKCIIKVNCSTPCAAKNREISEKYSIWKKRFCEHSLRGLREFWGGLYDATDLSDEELAEVMEWDDRLAQKTGKRHLPEPDYQVTGFMYCSKDPVRCKECSEQWGLSASGEIIRDPKDCWKEMDIIAHMRKILGMP